MLFDAFIFSKADLAKFTRIIDNWNEIRPIEITEGPDIGKFYLDKDIVNRIPELNNVLAPEKLNLNRVSEKQLDTTVINRKTPLQPLQKE